MKLEETKEGVRLKNQIFLLEMLQQQKEDDTRRRD